MADQLWFMKRIREEEFRGQRSGVVSGDDFDEKIASVEVDAVPPNTHCKRYSVNVNVNVNLYSASSQKRH